MRVLIKPTDALLSDQMLNKLTYTSNKLMSPRFKFLTKSMSFDGTLLTFTQTRHFPSAPSRGLARSAVYFPGATSSELGQEDGVVVREGGGDRRPQHLLNAPSVGA